MPYWSSSRVGALPQSSETKSKVTKRSHKHKGITMEDLKKQTALRLAQESGKEPVVETPPRVVPPEPIRVPSSMSASQSVDSATEMLSNAKLPHGLTVQELKEMTKARLQAEASTEVPTNIRLDNSNWETASQSTVNSDYPPDSYNPANSFSEEAIPFSRSASYPSNPQQQFQEWEQQNGFYDVPNRRRAATMSPRPGLQMLHEHRPTPSRFSSMSNVATPNSDLQRRPIPARSISAYESNRARASSAASLPTLSRTSDEFPTTPFRSPFRSVHEESPPVTGLSDVFRGSPSLGLGGGGAASSPFSSSNNNSSGNNTTTTTHIEERHRASTWDPSLDMFCGQDLSEDLASILKLSGATREDVPE